MPALRSAPDPTAPGRIVDALTTAERPVLLAGTGTMLSEAWGALLDLAELTQIPVATSLGGKGSIDETHRLSIGLIGRYSRKVANDIVTEADLVLVVGSRLGGMTTDTWKVPPPGSRIVHVDVDPTVLGTTYREELGVVGDARLTLEAITSCVRERGGPSFEGWADSVAARVADWRAMADRLGEQSAPGAIHPAAVMRALRKELDPQDILVTDTGYMGAWTGALYPVTAPGRHFLRRGWVAGLGFARRDGRRPGARRPEGRRRHRRRRGGLPSDGAQTALRCGIDMTVVVLNNQTLAFEYHGQKLQWNNRVMPQVNDFLDVDYAAVARAIGAEGIRVEEASGLERAIRQALTCGRAALVDVRIDREVWAPVTNFESVVPRYV